MYNDNQIPPIQNQNRKNRAPHANVIIVEDPQNEQTKFDLEVLHVQCDYFKSV